MWISEFLVASSFLAKVIPLIDCGTLLWLLLSGGSSSILEVNLKPAAITVFG